MDTQLKKLENPMLRLLGHIKQNSNCYAYVFRDDFLMAIIFTSPGVAVTPEINVADKKRKQFEFGKFCSHHSDVRL